MSSDSDVADVRCEVTMVRGKWNVLLVVDHAAGWSEGESIRIVEPNNTSALGEAVAETFKESQALARSYGLPQ